MFMLFELFTRVNCSKRQRGNVSLFGIGLGVMILAVGGFSIDLWQIIGTRKALTEVTDAAAAAGANQIDYADYRLNGDLDGTGAFRVDIASATTQGLAVGASLPESAVAKTLVIALTPDGGGVVATATGDVNFTFLGILSGTDSFEMRVTSTARPRTAP